MSAVNKGRTEFIGFYVTPLEKSEIQLAADDRSRSVSDYLRLALFDLIKRKRKKKLEDQDEEYASLNLDEEKGEGIDEDNAGD